jgi:PAS domain S-box-containing protein
MRHAPRPPLRRILILLSMVQIGGAVGAVGYFSFHNGRQAVQNLANQLIQSINVYAQDHIQHYLKVPQAINQLNANALQLGQVNPQDPGRVAQHFWHLRTVFEPVLISAMYFGTATGEFTGLGFQANGRWQIGRAGPETDYRFYSYAVDAMGRPAALVEQGKAYDPRQRPWYNAAIAAGTTHWSPIYLDFKEKRPKITLGRPIYQERQLQGQERQLQGVIGTDFVISHLEDFLRSIEVNPVAPGDHLTVKAPFNSFLIGRAAGAESGPSAAPNVGQISEILLVERSGHLVASARGEAIFDAQQQRVNLHTSTHALTRALGRALDTHFGSLEDIDGSQQLKLQFHGETHYVSVKLLGDRAGLDWLMIIVVPESTFMAAIRANTAKTIGLCIGALGLALVSSVLTARWLTRPIRQLSQASSQIAAGEAVPNLPGAGIQEMDLLAQAFNQMSHQVQQARQTLETYAHSLEQRVLERTTALQQSEEQYRTLVSNLPGAVYRCQNDEFWTMVYISDEITEIVGYPATDLINNRARSFASLIHSDDCALVQQAVDLGIHHREPYIMEYRLRHADGSIRWVYEKGQAIFNLAGNLQWLDGAIFDITDRKRAELQLIQSEKLAALGQLVASVAHEINTPLGAIHSSVENLSHFFDRDLETLPQFLLDLPRDEQAAFFAVLHQAAQGHPHMARLSRRERRQIKRAIAQQLAQQQIAQADLLADVLVDLGIQDLAPLQSLLQTADPQRVLNRAAQLTSVQKSLQTIDHATNRAAKVVFALRSYARQGATGKPVPTRITDGIETALTLYDSLIRRGITVQRDYADLPAIPCFPDELDQVWGNLIHNALQAMVPPGLLAIQTQVVSGAVEIVLTDTGTGIPADIQTKIFDPFFTTKLKGEGSGLGLSIVKKIIDKHHGTIHFTSQPGCTRFTIRLPINGVPLHETSPNGI